MKSDFAERGSANVEVVLGAVQEVVGRAIGDAPMESRGIAHQNAGEARNDVLKQVASERAVYVTREKILAMLSETEIASVSVAESAKLLSEGDEYVDLQHLDLGVQRAIGEGATYHDALPRKAVHPDTWAKVAEELNKTLSG